MSITKNIFFTFILLGINSWQIYILKKQRKEDLRARISLSVIAWGGMFLLKISNIGKETAYDINIKINSSFIKEHYSTHIKTAFDKLEQKSFSLEAGKSHFADLGSHYMNDDQFVFYGNKRDVDKEEFGGRIVNEWLKKHESDAFEITGNYCGNKYKIRERFSIVDFVAGSIVHYDDITAELKELNKSIKSIIKN